MVRLIGTSIVHICAIVLVFKWQFKHWEILIEGVGYKLVSWVWVWYFQWFISTSPVGATCLLAFLMIIWSLTVVISHGLDFVEKCPVVLLK